MTDEQKVPEFAVSYMWREKLGKLRSWNTYMPPVLRKRYLEILDELAVGLGVKAESEVPR